MLVCQEPLPHFFGTFVAELAKSFFLVQGCSLQRQGPKTGCYINWFPVNNRDDAVVWRGPNGINTPLCSLLNIF